jgi:ribosomal protein L5
MKPVLTNPSNRIRYYYENILRYDLLLKLNYDNIMQVPQICKIIILAYRVPYNNVKSVSLALEIICGQKVFCTILPDAIGSTL